MDTRDSAQSASPTAFLRELTTDALRYWESRRILYNALLAVIVVAHFVAAWPASKAAIAGDVSVVLFVLAVLANVAYCAAYVADLFIQLSAFRPHRTRWRLVVLAVGFAFAAALTNLAVGGLFDRPLDLSKD